MTLINTLCLVGLSLLIGNATNARQFTNSIMVAILPKNLKNNTQNIKMLFESTEDTKHFITLDDYNRETESANENAMTNLKNTSLNVGMVMSFPCAENKTGKPAGFCVQVLEILRESLGFQYEKKIYDTYLNNNENSTNIFKNPDLIGALARSDIDMALSYLMMTSIRKKFISFSHPIENSRICTVIKQPGLQKGIYEAFMAYVNIFHEEILGLIVFTWVVSTLITTACARYGKDEPKRSIFKGPIYNFIITTGIFFQQGVSTTPRALSCRVAFYTTWLTSLVVYYSFSSKVTSVKIAIPATSPFHTLHDVIKNTNYHILVRRNGLVYGVLQQSNSSLDKHFFVRLRAKTASYVETLDEGLNMVKHGTNYVMMVEGSEALSIIDCSYLMGPDVHRENVHFGFPINSTFKDIINNRIIKLAESGHLRRIWKSFYRKSNQHCQNLSDVSSDIQETLGLFITVLVGIGLSFILLCNEFVRKKCNPKC